MVGSNARLCVVYKSTKEEINFFLQLGISLINPVPGLPLHKHLPMDCYYGEYLEKYCTYADRHMHALFLSLQTSLAHTLKLKSCPLLLFMSGGTVI